jgi:DNA-binding MarR family transcriptional regulator
MSKKEKFIEAVEEALFSKVEPCDIDPDVMAYWQALKGKVEEDKPMFTDNGKLILKYMQDNPNLPMLKAKDIGEGLFISSRAVSGAIRKLVTDGFVEKVGQDPVVYSLTEQGKTVEII